MNEKPFSPGSLVKLCLYGEISEHTYAVQSYSEHYGGYWLVAPDGHSINVKEEEVVAGDDDTFEFDLRAFKRG